MRLRNLASLLVTSALAAAPAASAFADPTPIVSHAVTPTTTPMAAPADARHYAEREAKDPKVADYTGGDRIYIIGGSVVTAVLIVLLIVLLV